MTTTTHAPKAHINVRHELAAGALTQLDRYRRPLSGTVLELGSRGDHLTAILATRSESLIGLGRAAPTVERCRSLHPTARFLERDIRDVDSFDEGQFHGIVSKHGEIDLLGDTQRNLLLEQLRRIITPDGVLLFTSHGLKGSGGHSYVSREAQEQILRERGFLLLECLTPDGTDVGEGTFAYGRNRLHYAATPGF